jgi:hypothetical protein
MNEALRVFGLFMVFSFPSVLVGIITLSSSSTLWVMVGVGLVGFGGNVLFRLIPPHTDPELWVHVSLSSTAWFACLCVDRFVVLSDAVSYNVFGLSTAVVVAWIILAQRRYTMKPKSAVGYYAWIVFVNVVLLAGGVMNGESWIGTGILIFFFLLFFIVGFYYVAYESNFVRFGFAFWTACFVLQQASQYSIRNQWLYFSVSVVVAWGAMACLYWGAKSLTNRPKLKTNTVLYLGFWTTGAAEVALISLLISGAGDQSAAGAFCLVFTVAFAVLSFMLGERSLLVQCGSMIVMSATAWAGFTNLALGVVFFILQSCFAAWSQFTSPSFLGTVSTSTASLVFAGLAVAVLSVSRTVPVRLYAATFAINLVVYTFVGLYEVLRSPNGALFSFLATTLYAGASVYAATRITQFSAQAQALFVAVGVFAALLLVYLVWASQTLKRKNADAWSSNSASAKTSTS